jgi:thiamine biosynthesis lipoprotein
VLEVARGRARLRPGTQIDLGGIAKGWLADRLAEEMGGNALANLGGDLRACGEGPQGQGWPVGIGGVTVLLWDAAAATSGTLKRSWGSGLHHLIDPRSGRPAASDLQEVSVLAPSCSDAEVYAKTALLLGSTAAPSYLHPRASGWWLN